MSFKTDMHIHSWYSDGTMSPKEIVEKYYKDEYFIISITDHEVTDGIAEAQEAARGKDIKVVPGIELATDMEGRELHILGYYINKDDKNLREALDRLAVIRKRRNEELLRVLREKGLDIEEKDLIKREGQTYVGKPDFARALVSKGYISEISQAFQPGKYLESYEIKAIKRDKISTEDAIRLIKDAGGIPVLAHPCKIKGIGARESDEFKANFSELLKKLRSLGLKGLECIYPAHSDEERLFFIDMAGKYHLHVTEGSDFHGR